MAFESPDNPDHEIARALLAWYDCHRRDLPWRAKPGEYLDPYKVWLSEIMLQQTTVAAVKPYFAAFLARWPNIHLLADAKPRDVMQQWAGLGYYSRARNLHACAKIVAQNFGGNFPNSEAALQSLPGIGVYTAAAIAAIAFGVPAAAIDGNIERVVARLFGIKTPLPASKAAIKALAQLLVPSSRPGDFIQAMMDLGATLCTPKTPACALCPLAHFCFGRAWGSPETLPRKAPRPKRPTRYGAIFFVTRKDGAVLVRKRPQRGLLGGMTEFPGTGWEPRFDAGETLRHAPVAASYRKLNSIIGHSFTHFALRLEIFTSNVPASTRAPKGCRFVPRGDLGKEAFPSVMRKVFAAVLRDEESYPYASGVRALQDEREHRRDLESGSNQKPSRN
jgi:A/G-specific adenine glycosylase